MADAFPPLREEGLLRPDTLVAGHAQDTVEGLRALVNSEFCEEEPRWV